MFFLLNSSDAAPNMATSDAPAFTCRESREGKKNHCPRQTRNKQMNMMRHVSCEDEVKKKDFILTNNAGKDEVLLK